jgi:hypothetical protein
MPARIGGSISLYRICTTELGWNDAIMFEEYKSTFNRVIDYLYTGSGGNENGRPKIYYADRLIDEFNNPHSHLDALLLSIKASEADLNPFTVTQAVILTTKTSPPGLGPPVISC